MDAHHFGDERQVSTVTPPDIITSTSISTSTYTPAEWRTLQELRDRYQQDRDLWSAREWAHLRFLRWLVQTGRLVS